MNINNGYIRYCIFLSMMGMIFIGSANAQDSFVILNSTDVPTMLKNIEYIENNGGKIVHIFPPNILIGDIPLDKMDSIIGQNNIVEIRTDKIDTHTINKYDKITKIAAEVWNNVFKNSIKEKNLVVPSSLKPLDDARTINDKNKIVHMPIILSSTMSAPPYGATFYDTSEYMIGNIVVGIIFLESNGAIDPNTESWSNAEESNVINEIVGGLNWWKLQDSRSKLTFTYNINYKVPTRYEPISRSSYSDGLWIADAMTYLGFQNYANYFDNVYDLNNYLRNRYDTDWAYTIFVVDSSKDPDGNFADGYSAYAWIGGPYVVMTYDNDGYGISNMDYVTAHETGHIFYATDEYNGYTEYSGYLDAHDIENSGKIMHCPLCWGISSGTALQIGWRDSDGDKIFDIIDFYPTSSLYVYSPDPTKDNTPTYKGMSTTTQTYTNRNPYGSRHNITVNKIKNVQYRTDGGYWINTTPKDGKFNGNIEDFIFTTPKLSDGTHNFEVRSYHYPANDWETIYKKDILTVNANPPLSIENLKNITYKRTYINWTWKDPSNTDFAKVMVYIDGKFKTNVTKGKQFFNATGLIPNMYYKINTHTVDTMGNINQTWRNHTAKTSY